MNTEIFKEYLKEVSIFGKETVREITIAEISIDIAQAT